jgi:tRNA pseudouridine55 synthase
VRRMVTTADGLLIIDKPAGWTSHDVVAKLRRLTGTKRVGHAGTLDPLATGVLVIGVGKATRLLGHLTLAEKEYLATIRLGQATDTCDAEGSVIASAPASGVTLAAVQAAARQLTGVIQQTPPAISAIKVGGTRAHRLARAGGTPALTARAVTVRSLRVLAERRSASPDPAAPPTASPDPAAPPTGELVDVDVAVTCSSGTYIRALARDLGEALGVGGHVTVLRRTRAGAYDLSMAHGLDDLEPGEALIPLERAAADAFPSRLLTDDEARWLSHGGRLPGSGASPGPVAAFGPDGTLIALVEEGGDQARPLAVFVP